MAAAKAQDRPFFAFLNYFDAHAPYIPLPRYQARFGTPRRSPRDYQVLHTFEYLDKEKMPKRDILMARDCYDECIAFLDEQLGKLLDELERQNLLDSTLVVITSDHGEAFGDHLVFGHGNSLYLDEIAVPLVILSPGAPAGRVVFAPVSLRDLPATVIDQLGLADGSPFPGHSLAAYWWLTPGQKLPEVSPALSEQVKSTAFEPHAEHGPSLRAFQMSLVAEGRHYFRDDSGSEHLHDLSDDQYETILNLASSPASKQLVGFYRKMLLDALNGNPGSLDAESAYLNAYKHWLKSAVEDSSSPGEPTTALK